MTLTKQEKEQIARLENRLSAIEGKLQKIQNLLVGIAIGIAIGGVIFGVISVKEFLSYAK